MAPVFQARLRFDLSLRVPFVLNDRSAHAKEPLSAFLAALLLFPIGSRAGVVDVVVSQIMGGGGNAGATFRTPTSQLFNAGSSTVDISGWTVQHATAAGTSWQPTALSGAIAPGPYYLVESHIALPDAPLPAADATSTGQPRRNQREDRTRSGLNCTHVRRFGGKLLGRPTGGGTASAMAARATSKVRARRRGFPAPHPGGTLRANDGCTDTGGNASDFAAGTPVPRNPPASPVNPARAGPRRRNGSRERRSRRGFRPLGFPPPPPPGTFTSGDRPAALPERVTVSSNNTTGYSLVVARTRVCSDRPSAGLSATTAMECALTGGTLVPISNHSGDRGAPPPPPAQRAETPGRPTSGSPRRLRRARRDRPLHGNGVPVALPLALTGLAHSCWRPPLPQVGRAPTGPAWCSRSHQHGSHSRRRARERSSCVLRGRRDAATTRPATGGDDFAKTPSFARPRAQS